MNTRLVLMMDGKYIDAQGGESLLDAAKRNGIFIPTLCQLKGLEPVAACRLCLVEAKGSNKLLPACVTRVEEGMEITSNSERLQRYRQMILGLLFAERNHVCSVCVANGHCDLQSWRNRRA